MTHHACPVEAAAARWTDHPGLIAETGSWTFGAWHERASRQATDLSAAGWRPGDRIGIIDTATPDVAMLVTAALQANLVACITSPRWTPRQLDQAMVTAGWRGLVAADGGPASIDSVRPSASIRSHAAGHLDTISGLATILFSSGSTGLPKAIAHRHDAHWASAAGACSNLPLRPGDRWLVSLSMSHVAGLGILFRCLHAGATVVMPSSHSPLDRQLRDWQPTHLSLVPTQLKRLLDQGFDPPAGLKALLLGGAAIPPGLVTRAVSRGWPLMTTYGLTEMASQVTATHPGAGRAELATSGHVLIGRELRIGDGGEILVRGSTLCEGFVRDGILTAATDAAGWYHTGDIGHLDAAGNLCVTGRRDNLFISGGENIYPEEIEGCLLELPEVRHACVVAVSHPEYGHRPFAFVDAALIDSERLRAALAERLPKFKIPDAFAPWPVETPLKPHRPSMAMLAERLLAEMPRSKNPG